LRKDDERRRCGTLPRRYPNLTSPSYVAAPACPIKSTQESVAEWRDLRFSHSSFAAEEGNTLTAPSTKLHTNSNWSPISIRQVLICPGGNSSMLWVLKLMLVMRNGASRCQTFITCRFLLRATTSMGNSIPKVCMPDEGMIRSPHPASSRLLPNKPIRRVRDVSAVMILVQTTVALVVSMRFIRAIRLSRAFCGISRTRARLPPKPLPRFE
jgi:hypothetical protein